MRPNAVHLFILQLFISNRYSRMESLDAALVCAICQCRLLQPTSGAADSALDPFAINPCGHVFHRQCTLDWIQRHPTCPSCRCTVENSRKLFFAQDEHPADEFGGGSEQQVTIIA